MRVRTREEHLQRDIEDRSITSINVDFDMFVLAVEQSGVLSGGVREPDSLHDPRTVHLRQDRVAILGPDSGISAVEPVVVATGPIVRAEADRLDGRITQSGKQSQIVQLSRCAGWTKAGRGGKSRLPRNGCSGLRQ